MDGNRRHFKVIPAVALGIAALLFLGVSLGMCASWLRPTRMMTFASMPWHAWLNAAQGTSAALAIVSGAWIIWGTGRLTTRLAVSAAMITLLIFLWQLPFRVDWSWLRYEQQLLVGCIWLLAIGLVAAAWRFGIRVVDPAGQILGADPRSRQMSLLGLLMLMTGVACLLAGVRLILPRDFANWNINGDGIFALLTQISGTLLVFSTVITCFHVPRTAWLNLALALGFIVVISLLHLVAYGQSLRLTLLPPEPRLQVNAVYYVVLAAWLLAAVGVLHAGGLSLRRCAPWGRVVPLPAAS